jgi:hypothetical protein
MSDLLVQALREGIEPYEGITAAEEVMGKAADEIERLRAALTEIIERADECSFDEDARAVCLYRIEDIAKEALNGTRTEHTETKRSLSPD